MSRSYIALFTVLTLSTLGCTASQDSDEATGSSDRPESAPITQPALHPAYAPSTKDPLAALYGGRDPQAGAAEVNAADLKQRLKQIKPVELSAPLPSVWFKTLKRLSESPYVRVSRWSYHERARMDRAPRDLSIELTIKAWGKRSQVDRELSSLRQIKSLRGKIPRRWGDGHEHVARSKNQELIIKRSSIRAADSADPTDPTVLMTLELTWKRETPISSATAPDKLRSCRYLPGLSASDHHGFPRWSIPHFKSISTRRFIESSFERAQNATIGRATWIYRNGEQHDLAIKWWVQRLEAQKATKTSSQGLEQSWDLSSGDELSWWPETNPHPMGCKVAGSLLTFESRRSSN